MMKRNSRRVVTAVVVVLAVILVAVLFRPLVAWFTGGDMSPGSSMATVKANAGALSLALRLRTDPLRQQGNELFVDVTDANGKPVTGATVTVEYFMPAMGAMSEMKGTAKIDAAGDGSHRARFDLPMAGSWTLTTRVHSPHGDGEVKHTATVGNKGLTLISASGDATGTGDDGNVGNVGNDGGLSAVKPLELSPQALGAIQEAMSSLDQVRAKLAADTLDGIAEPATRTSTMLRDAAALVAVADAKERLDEATAAAVALGRARDVAQARTLFSVVSSDVTALAAADPRLQQGWQVFECPMVTGFNKWLQRGDALENPYMGKKMLTCGTASTFTMPTAVAMPGHGHDHATHDAAGGNADEIEYYTCSMHPSVKQEQPGTCPICSMNLTPVTKGEIASGVVVVDDVRRQKIGVKTARVEKRTVDATITTVGRVVYDEEKLYDVTLKIGGFVEDLFVDETGQKVNKGQPLFLLYSPELYAAQVEYLQALKTAQTLHGSEFSQTLIRSAKRRLELWDLGDKQIEALVARGEATDRVPILSPASGYVVEKNIVRGAKIDEGATVYRIADLDKVWIEADVFEADLPKVSVGQTATVTLTSIPGKELEGKVGFIYPFLDKGTRTGRVRVELPNPGLALKPEMYANVALHGSEAAQLVVAESAVVYTGPRRLVFVDLGEGRLQPVVVQLGRKIGGFFEVLGGLKEGDVVVTSGNFLVAAESRLKGAVEFWAEGDAAVAEPATGGHDGSR